MSSLRKCIVVSPDTHSRLEALGNKNDSFDYIISKLLDKAGNIGGKQ